MKIAVVIVNHNSCKLLKQAINSLNIATKSIKHELIVVDNASTDKSLAMLAENFPAVRVISNETNVGMAKAYNQALSVTTGEYILLVNPDTICDKTSFEKIFAFMDGHADAAGLALRMLSPQGRFLPESIHGLSTTWAAFFKFIGFAKHLPKTRLYDRNRKDWVEEFQISEIDILNADCMFLRRSALNETGLFDERFVMAGYNIDLSHRMRLAGFKNYYFPKAYIINFESQPFPKLSWNYVKYFYGAMAIFAIKHLFKMPEFKIAHAPRLVTSALDVE
jgi:GT2 family glycosyltransferase